MSAAGSAIAVLDWCAAPAGPPPRGDLQDLDALVRPGAAARAALARTVAVAAARLGLSPLLPRPGSAPLAAEPLWLAAAIGAAPHTAADRLIDACPPTRVLADLIARHAVVGPALLHLPGDTAEQLLLRSPLTAVLMLPPRGGEDEAVLLCERLAATPAGRRLLVHAFAAAEAHAGLLGWRGRLMEALRLGSAEAPARPELIVDIVEAALAQHRAEWSALLRRALGSLATESDGARLGLALAAGRWWESFRAVHRNTPRAVRERGYLDFHVYLDGLRLAALAAALRAAPAGAASGAPHGPAPTAITAPEPSP
jgi:hypothetical protein